MGLMRLIKDYFSSAQTILKSGLESPEDFESALDELDILADRLHDLVEKRAPYLLKEDTTPISLHAEVASESIGTSTLSGSSLSAALIQRDQYSIAVAKALSVAAVEGGEETTSVATFTSTPGADFSFTKVETFSGENFDAAAEMVFAIDFGFLEMSGIEILREANQLADTLRTDIDEGNVATVEIDLVAAGDDTAITTEIDAMVIADLLSSTSVSADLHIA